MPGSGTPAGEAQSPLRGEEQPPADRRHLHFCPPSAGGHRRVRLESRAWKHKQRSRLFSLVITSVFEILGSLEAELKGRAGRTTPAVRGLLSSARINAGASPGFNPTPSSAVPFNAQERWLCKMARLSAWCCVQGPPALPPRLLGSNKNSPKCCHPQCPRLSFPSRVTEHATLRGEVYVNHKLAEIILLRNPY